jgi:hypothetical protein
MAKASETITANPNPTIFINEIYFPLGTPNVLNAD